MQVHVHLLGAVDDMLEETGSTADNAGGEIPHQHNLPLGAAAGSRNDGRSQRLRPIVESQSPGKQPVAIRVQEHVPEADAKPGEHSQHGFRPDIQIGASIRHQDLLAGGPARGMIAQHLLAGHGQHLPWIGLLQLLLAHQRYAHQIIQTTDTQRVDAGGGERPFVARHRGNRVCTVRSRRCCCNARNSSALNESWRVARVGDVGHDDASLSYSSRSA